MAPLRALDNVPSPSFKRGGTPGRPTHLKVSKWETSTNAELAKVNSPERREEALSARAAGGKAAPATLHDKTVDLFTTSNAPAQQGLNLRSAFVGAGILPGGPEATSGARASARPASPRPASPRFMQPTLASERRSVQECDAPAVRADSAPPMPAGGASNTVSKTIMDLNNDPSEAPRTLRRRLSPHRSRAGECFVHRDSIPSEAGTGGVGVGDAFWRGPSAPASALHAEAERRRWTHSIRGQTRREAQTRRVALPPR